MSPLQIITLPHISCSRSPPPAKRRSEPSLNSTFSASHSPSIDYVSTSNYHPPPIFALPPSPCGKWKTDYGFWLFVFRFPLSIFFMENGKWKAEILAKNTCKNTENFRFMFSVFHFLFSVFHFLFSVSLQQATGMCIFGTAKELNHFGHISVSI